MNASMSPFLILTITLCLFSLTIISLGIYGRSILLSPAKNPCKMSYSSRSAVYLPIDLPFPSSFQLLQYSETPQADLNPYPVLFVPGSDGSYDQIRSFASSLSHNKKQLFQYFTLNFNTSLSALHASTIIQQAAFVNEAIRRIIELYVLQKGTSIKVGLFCSSF